MKLKRWLKLKSMTAADFAVEMGVTKGAVSRWLSTKRRPRVEQLRDITRVTDGKVKPQDFYS